jgi:DNA-binding response OmpR family regulator
MLRKRILFIDDEDLLREAIYELLTEMDYEVTVKERGKYRGSPIRGPSVER